MGTRRERAAQKCPICGREQFVSTLYAHVASERCLADLQYVRSGKCHHSRGHEVLQAAIALAKLLLEVGHDV